MRKSCQYCGHVHPIGYQCPKRPVCGKHRDGRIDRFRKTAQWVHKREDILERDGYRCWLCEQEQAPRRYNPGRLSVHHIEPLVERWDLRLEEGNLITLCDKHHEEAERGLYARELLHELTGYPPGETHPRDGSA